MSCYNRIDDVFYPDLTADIARDMEIVKQKTSKAIALDAVNVAYISNGTDWKNFASNAVISYYVITLTIGDNTTLKVVDAAGIEYVSGSRIAPGTVLTITAAADEGYDLTTYTVATVDKTADNPTEHTMSASMTVVTEATEAE